MDECLFLQVELLSGRPVRLVDPRVERGEDVVRAVVISAERTRSWALRAQKMAEGANWSSTLPPEQQVTSHTRSGNLVDLASLSERLHRQVAQDDEAENGIVRCSELTHDKLPVWTGYVTNCAEQAVVHSGTEMEGWLSSLPVAQRTSAPAIPAPGTIVPLAGMAPFPTLT